MLKQITAVFRSIETHRLLLFTRFLLLPHSLLLFAIPGMPVTVERTINDINPMITYEPPSAWVPGNKSADSEALKKVKFHVVMPPLTFIDEQLSG